MADPVRRGATYEDVLSAPDHLIAEIVAGDLYTSPRPGFPHGSAASTLAGDLIPAFQRGRGGPGGWWIVFEPELHLGDDVLVPDLSGWRRERMPARPNTHSVSLSPDWVCEVVSPATSGLDRMRKLPRCALHGVPYAWIIDPAARALEVFHLVGEHYSLIAAHEGEEMVRAEPFEAVEIELGALWV